MLPSATLRVPVEISPRGQEGQAPRVFRLLERVAADRFQLAAGLPDEPEWLRGTLQLRFHLPGDALAIECDARAIELVFGRDTDHEHAAYSGLDPLALPPEAAERIERYVEARNELSPRV